MRDDLLADGTAIKVSKAFIAKVATNIEAACINLQRSTKVDFNVNPHKK